MTFDEALKELGIDAGEGPKGARKAYLRLLRERRPERDAEGFKRLRQAYELVNEHFAAYDALHEAFQRASAEAVGGTPRPITAEAKPGLDLSDVADRHRTVLTAYELRTLRRVQSPSRAVELVHRLTERGRTDVAALILSLLVERVAHNAEDGLPLEPFIREICGLHAKGAASAGNRIAEKLDAWLKRSGREVDLLAGDAAALWHLTRELCSLPGKLRPEVRRALVTLIVEEDHALAEKILSRFVREHMDEARELERLLRIHAPTLGGFLNLPRHDGSDESSFVPDWLWWVALGGLVGILILLLWRVLDSGTHCAI